LKRTLLSFRKMYTKIVRPILFLFSPEYVHRLVFRCLKIAFAVPGMKLLVSAFYRVDNQALKRNLFGLTFSNPVGLAAGFDKDAELVDELACFGFGFIEIGTLTPKAQPGNEKPRMFRLPADEALINRMGFNNEGVEAAVRRLRKRKSRVIIAGNIGKNKVTPNEEAGNDYEKCFEVLFDYVDFFVVNVSSPNTPDLRALQDKEPLKKLLTKLQDINRKKTNPKAILLKIAPDLSDSQLDDIVSIVSETKIEGVIATNTTIERSSLRTPEDRIKAVGSGGLSGKPLSRRSTEVIRYLSEKSGKSFIIIGVGGIHSAEDAIEKLNAGASLVQIYTGFIYEGPGLIKKINKKIMLNAKC
jgi:dihydroorotate dehydrogenase